MQHGAYVVDSAVDARAEIGKYAQIGPGCRVTGSVIEGHIGAGTVTWRMAHVMTGAIVGRDCMLAQNVLVADSAVLGDRVRVQNNTCISRKVKIEDDVYIGAGVMFCNSRHPRADGSDELWPIVVERGASIGCNACIMGGVTIGAGAMIGANSTVTRDVAAGTTVVGSPAVAR